MRTAFLLLVIAGTTASSACVDTSRAPRTVEARPSGGLVRAGTPDEVNIAKARARGSKVTVDWQPWSDATFERARHEKKLLLVDGAAAWCHWCHVMDETTYSDPEVGKLIAERFIAVRVDIDERPDIADRYGDWGWPATIVLSPDAEEIGKYRGYIAKDELLPILRAAGDAAKMDDDADPGPSAPIDALGWLLTREKRDLDAYYDKENAGWGMRQKAPLGEDAEAAIVLGAKGDAAFLEKGTATLVAERALIDRVDGGIYQYSAGSTWNEPHYEKLMTMQAANLEAYARAYATTHDAAFLADARDLERYIDTILSSPDGAFYVTQDADVNAHDETKAFVDGKVYYEKDAVGRRALGSPRVDTHVYAFENGLAISALVALYEATHDDAVLARARKAADRMLTTHIAPDGSVRHDPENGRTVLYLADAASFGFALARLAEATGDAKYRDAAIAIAKTMDDRFRSDTAALFAETKDTHAAGVFARRRIAFPANVLAARLHAATYRLTKDEAERVRGEAIVAAIATPGGLEGEGRNLGNVLLALDELGLTTKEAKASAPPAR